MGCWEVALEILAATQQGEIQLSNGDLGCSKSLGKPDKKTVNFGIPGTSKLDQNGVFFFFGGGENLEDDVPMISNVFF